MYTNYLITMTNMKVLLRSANMQFPHVDQDMKLVTTVL